MEQPKILVAIRKRPLNSKQQSKGNTDIIAVKNRQTVIVSQYKQKVDLTKYLQQTVFNFDYAYNQHTTNQQIYESAVRPLVDSAFQGAKVTCFAYGQTGSGKTFTMNGVPNKGIPGMYTLGAQDIFAYLADPRFQHLKAKLSFFEIYCGKLYDLLNKRQELKMRQDNKSNINIIGLEEIPISAWEQFIQLLNYGASQRITSQNSANPQSSRSHAILQISLKDGKKLFGKMSFIDLAGNQRGADHMDMSKQTRIDGAEINKSLLSLKQCIRALDQGKGHTPFRGSKLTMVLKDSFIGFCRTVMIGNISPSSSSSENTLNTLRYADRVKQLRKPSNELSSKQQIKARQMMLPRQNNKNVVRISIDRDDDAQDIERKREIAQKSFGIVSQSHSTQQGMKRQGSNGSFINQIPQNNLNNLLPAANLKQPIANSNPLKISMVHNRKSPLLGNQKGLKDLHSQIPNNIGKRYSEDINDLNVPESLFKANSMNMNPAFESGVMNRKVQTNLLRNNAICPPGNSCVRMDIENGFNSNQNYMPMNRNSQSQTENYFKQPNGNTSANNLFNNNGTKPVLKSRQSMQIQSEPSLKFRIPNPQHQQPRNFQIQVPPLFSQNQKPINHQNHIDFQVPNNWVQTIEMISTTNNPNLMAKLQLAIDEHLIVDQSNLMEKHSNTLRREIQTIKEEMTLISKVQTDKSSISTREYVGFLQESIEQKLSSLELLRQQLTQFAYKLDQVQEVDERIRKVRGNQGMHMDDEQLLDDLH